MLLPIKIDRQVAFYHEFNILSGADRPKHIRGVPSRECNAGTGFLFPIEGTWQYTFGTGHYSFTDCIKGNWPITAVGMLCCIILIPVLSLLYSGIGLIG